MKVFIVGLLLIAIFHSCVKPYCPDPTVDPRVPQTYRVTLQGDGQSQDAHTASIVPTGSYPTNPRFHALAWTQSGNPTTNRSFINFDFSSIPSGASLTSATLTLYADTSFDFYLGLFPPGHYMSSGGNASYVHQVTSNWDETTVTWATQPSVNAANAISIPTTTTIDQALVIDVTSFVQDQLAYPASYHGFRISLQNETIYKHLTFYSSEGIYPTLAPKLELEYVY